MSDPIEFLEKLLKVARRSDDVEFLIEQLFLLKRSGSSWTRALQEGEESDF